jgi:hypothetical protein
MRAYYNEIDPHMAAWTRELMRNGLIAEGAVRRSERLGAATS